MAGIDSIKGLFIDNENILDIDYKEPKLDKKLTIIFAMKNRGSVRLSQGLFYTKDEWENRRKELLSKSLP